MVLEVALRPRARADIKEIARHTLRTWGRTQARRYVRGLDDAMKRLAEHPELGHRCPEVAPELRQQPSGEHLVFYFVTTVAIDVVRVLHKRMDPERHVLS